MVDFWFVVFVDIVVWMVGLCLGFFKVNDKLWIDVSFLLFLEILISKYFNINN